MFKSDSEAVARHAGIKDVLILGAPEKNLENPVLFGAWLLWRISAPF